MAMAIVLSYIKEYNKKRPKVGKLPPDKAARLREQKRVSAAYKRAQKKGVLQFFPLMCCYIYIK